MRQRVQETEIGNCSHNNVMRIILRTHGDEMNSTGERDRTTVKSIQQGAGMAIVSMGEQL